MELINFLIILSIITIQLTTWWPNISQNREKPAWQQTGQYCSSSKCWRVTTVRVVKLSKVTTLTSHHIHLTNHKRGNQHARTVEVTLLVSRGRLGWAGIDTGGRTRGFGQKNYWFEWNVPWQEGDGLKPDFCLSWASFNLKMGGGEIRDSISKQILQSLGCNCRMDFFGSYFTRHWTHIHRSRSCCSSLHEPLQPERKPELTERNVE